MPWIVMTSAAKMPLSVKHKYRNVALVHITEEYARKGKFPKMISARARGVIPAPNGKAVIHLGHYLVGNGTKKSAIYRAIADAERQMDILNRRASTSWEAQAAEEEAEEAEAAVPAAQAAAVPAADRAVAAARSSRSP
jgi:hypothetical protein